MKLQIGQPITTCEVTLLGHPGGGKTTFLALLAAEARRVEPTGAATALAQLLEQLRQGKPVPGTLPGGEGESDYRFLIDGLDLGSQQECFLKTHDLAGECTSELVKLLRTMRTPEQSGTGRLKESLSRSDVVIVSCLSPNWTPRGHRL